MKSNILSRKFILLIFLYLMAACLMSTIPFSNGWAAKSSSTELPKTIYWACRYVGGALHTIPSIMADKIAPVLKRKIRMIPGADSEMINMLRAGRAHLATFAADNYWASMGLAQYANFSLGPQPLRLIWPGLPYAGVTGVSTKTSGIKTLADLKGKSVVRVVGAGWSETGLRGSLAFAKLTVDDVKIYEVSSAGAGYNALAEGKADFNMIPLTSGGARKIEASPYGLYIIPYPHENKEGWSRFRNEGWPYAFPGWSTTGAGIQPGERIPTPIYPWPITTTLATQSNEFVYSICKAIHSQLKEIIAAYKPNEAMKIERAIIPEATTMAPFHPGAIKYFKEINVWTNELEAANKKRLGHLEKVNERWEIYVEDAEERMEKAKKKVDPRKEWPAIVKNEIGLLP